MKVVAYASRQHYADHIAPVYAALPDELHGGVYGPRDVNGWGRQLPARTRGSEPVLYLVASYVDAAKVAGQFVYLEHGAGQSYGGDPGSARNVSYAGGDGRAFKLCRLVIAPGAACAARHRTARDCRVVAVGCPYLDQRLRQALPAGSDRPIVAFTFHWDAAAVCPEARTALPHYERGLEGAVADLRAQGWEVWGHGHPRAQGTLRAMWRSLGVPWVSRDAVFDEANVLVADNTSLSWEFAALDRPIVLLDAPWYRRDVEHGLRFWSTIAGIPRCQTASEIPDAVSLALADPTEIRDRRRWITSQVYSYTDGRSAERAADAIRSIACPTP